MIKVKINSSILEYFLKHHYVVIEISCQDKNCNILGVSSYEEFVKVFLKIIVFDSISYKGYGSKGGVNRKILTTNTI